MLEQWIHTSMILDFLKRVGGEQTVTDIYIALRTDQSNVSTALSKLSDHGLVQGRRKGKWVYYTLDKKRYAEYKQRLARIENIINEWHG